MMMIPGLLMAAAGTFLFLWYRTLAGLPLKRQPSCIRRGLFKWGVPALALVLFAEGVVLLVKAKPEAALAAVAVSAVLCALVIRFDRYSAEMRLIRDQYLSIRQADPRMEEMEVLFLTARSRYPQWSHDRVVELVAGKDIQTLCLLIILSENEINPIQDWELYRSLKTKAKRIIPSGERPGLGCL